MAPAQPHVSSWGHGEPGSGSGHQGKRALFVAERDLLVPSRSQRHREFWAVPGALGCQGRQGINKAPWNIRRQIRNFSVSNLTGVNDFLYRDC